MRRGAHGEAAGEAFNTLSKRLASCSSKDHENGEVLAGIIRAGRKEVRELGRLSGKPIHDNLISV